MRTSRSGVALDDRLIVGWVVRFEFEGGEGTLGLLFVFGRDVSFIASVPSSFDVGHAIDVFIDFDFKLAIDVFAGIAKVSLNFSVVDF